MSIVQDAEGAAIPEIHPEELARREAVARADAEMARQVAEREAREAAEKAALMERLKAISGRSIKSTNTCLAKAAEDEPLFVIRAQDASAVRMVQYWIDMNIGRLGSYHPKITDAAELRDAMAAYHTIKPAD